MDREGTYERDESVSERLDRNWAELLQELRVSQTGVQLIAGFLLTLPFQSKFYDLSTFDRNLYLVLVVLAACTIALTLAPISIHRRLFRQHVKERLVTAAHRIMRLILVGISLLISGITMLIFDVVIGRTAGAVVGGAVLLVLVSVLVVLPMVLARLGEPDV